MRSSDSGTVRVTPGGVVTGARGPGARILRRIRRIARIIDRMAHRAPTYGLRSAVRLTFGDRVPGGPPIALERPGFSAPMFIRLGGSDLLTFDQVIIDDAYRPPWPIDPAVIIDAGANIGLSAIWFANRYPDATIIAIEPDAENHALLERNVAPYPKVQSLRAALWTHDGEVTLTDPGIGAWGFQVGEAVGPELATGITVPAVTVGTLLDRFDISRVDLLKVDIEGSERELFTDASTWIDRVDIIAIELHDRFAPGCSRAFLGATGAFDLEATRGETTWVARSGVLGGDTTG